MGNDLRRERMKEEYINEIERKEKLEKEQIYNQQQYVNRLLGIKPEHRRACRRNIT